jgi:hypothetical protein
MQSIEPRLVRREPVPLFQLEIAGAQYTVHPPFDHFALLQRASELSGVDLWDCGFRGINASKLPSVIRNGIDVDPTTSIVFVDDFEKAWEYGQWPKIIIALDWSKLDHTFREVPAATSSEELTSLCAKFPTKRVSKDGSLLWLSRLGDNDPRVTTEYEVAYARWIPGNPFDALRAVFAFGLTDADLSAAVGHAA